MMIRLTVVVLLFSRADGWSADFQKDADADVEEDYAVALREWEHLAIKEDISAQYNLGVMYATGHGVIQNYNRTHMWYNIAASQGNARAKENKELVAKMMTRSDISTAQHLADAYVMKGYKWC